LQFLVVRLVNPVILTFGDIPPQSLNSTRKFVRKLKANLSKKKFEFFSHAARRLWILNEIMPQLSIVAIF